ncbi:MAG: helix-turn-helix transcriptional regulator [Novosphingobium sp.]|nr:helix-turn-helix transcriptional regulator [Novosphingobium sp.]
MKVATEMFVDRGYAATTLLDIAKVAGVATRTLYQHFGDKEAIFKEVVYARDVANVMPPEIEDGDDLALVLRKTADYSYEVALRPRSRELMRLMIAESARFPEMMSKITNTIFARFKANVADVFRKLNESGLIPDGDHDKSAEIFVDLLLGNRTTMIYFGWLSDKIPDEDTEAKLELFVRGRFGLDYPSKPAKSASKKAGTRAKSG